jgi:uncharacterized protein
VTEVVLDSNILVPSVLRDSVLTLAEHELLEPRWTRAILAEFRRVVINRRAVPPATIDRTLTIMTEVFPEAMIVNWERHVDATPIGGVPHRRRTGRAEPRCDGFAILARPTPARHVEDRPTRGDDHPGVQLWRGGRIRQQLRPPSVRPRDLTVLVHPRSRLPGPANVEADLTEGERVYAVELTFGDERERLAARPAHRELLQALHRDGVLVMAGPLADDSGALLIFDVADAAALDDVIARDPYYRTPGVTVTARREWSPIIR